MRPAPLIIFKGFRVSGLGHVASVAKSAIVQVTLGLRPFPVLGLCTGLHVRLFSVMVLNPSLTCYLHGFQDLGSLGSR